MRLHCAAMILLMAFNGCANRPDFQYPKMTKEQKAELREVCNNDDDKSKFDPECSNLEEWFGRIQKQKP